ncbi:hypothetical protein PG988_002250 [Apiospora saccharicola]
MSSRVCVQCSGQEPCDLLCRGHPGGNRAPLPTQEEIQDVLDSRLQGLFAAVNGDYVRVTSGIKACQGATVEGFRVKAEEVERQARGKAGAMQSFREVTAAAQQHVAKAEAVEVERRHGLLAWLSLAKMAFSTT